MASPDRQRLRTTFDEPPELYDRARPSYPPQLFDDLIALVQLPTAARLLEIGCGTGIATVPLASVDSDLYALSSARGWRL